MKEKAGSFLNTAFQVFSSMKQRRLRQCCSVHASGRQFIRRHNTPETALLQLCMQPGCCVWDAPQQSPVLVNFHWCDQASELSLPHASLAGFLDTNPPSINYLQKWCSATLILSFFLCPCLPWTKIHPTVKRPVRQVQLSPALWRGPAQECMIRSWASLGLAKHTPTVLLKYSWVCTYVT